MQDNAAAEEQKAEFLLRHSSINKTWFPKPEDNWAQSPSALLPTLMFLFPCKSIIKELKQQPRLKGTFMSPESCSALRVPWWFHPCCSPLNLSPGAPRAVWLTRPRIKLPIYFGTIHSEGPKTQIKSIPLCVYLQLLTLLRTNLQIQTNVRCVMGLEKQSGRGWGCARRFLRGGRAGRGGSPGKDYKKFNFTLITTGAIFCPRHHAPNLP